MLQAEQRQLAGAAKERQEQHDPLGAQRGELLLSQPNWQHRAQAGKLGQRELKATTPEPVG